MLRWIGVYLAGLTVLAAMFACDVDVKEEGKLPDVDVESKGGQLPKYEVEKTQEGKLPDVDVDAQPGTMPNIDVQTPDVDVDMKEKTIKVPDIDVNTPAEQDTQPTQ